jgi:hypothetical protein
VTVSQEVAVLHQSISGIHTLLSTRSTPTDSGAFDDRFAFLEHDISVLCQRINSEQLYRHGQAYLLSDRQFCKCSQLELSYLEH